MPSVRYILRLIYAFISRFKLLILLSVAIGIIIFIGIRFFLPYIFGPAVQRIGLSGRYTTSNLPTSITRMIGNGLTRLDESGSVEPDLAASWETPDKGKTWIFKLKDGITWQDGTKITSATINYQFSDVTVERPDAKTLIFNLQNPYSAFPSVVSRPIFKSGLLGSGNWEVKKLSLAGTFISDMVVSKKNSERIEYRFYPSEEQAILAFELGNIDSLNGILNPDPLNTWKKAKINQTTDTGVYVAVFLNTQDKVLSDKNLRQALDYAVNKDALGGERAISPISISSWAYNPQVKPYDFDREKAKGLIDDYKKGAKITDLPINLTVAPVLLSQAEKIKNDWEAVGITVNIQVMANVPSDYQALLAIFDTPDDPDQYSLWHSTQTQTNITHYSNPRIDKLLEDGRSEIDVNTRKQIYLDFQRFLVEDCPAAFLYYPTIYTISRK